MNEQIIKLHKDSRKLRNYDLHNKTDKRHILETLEDLRSLLQCETSLAEKEVIADELIESYKDFSMPEIKLAFQKTLNGSIRVDLPFNPKLKVSIIGLVLSAYRDFRSKAISSPSAARSYLSSGIIPDEKNKARKSRYSQSVLFGIEDGKYNGKKIDLKHLYNEALETGADLFQDENRNIAFWYYVCDYNKWENVPIPKDIEDNYFAEAKNMAVQFKKMLDKPNGNTSKAFELFCKGNNENKFYNIQLKFHQHLCFRHWILECLEMEMEFNDLFE
jgi:hypothetical protein